MTKFHKLLRRIVISDYNPERPLERTVRIEKVDHHMMQAGGVRVTFSYDITFSYGKPISIKRAFEIPLTRIIEQQINES